MYYKTCPKCGHTRTREDLSAQDRCPRCGLIFHKWFKHKYRSQNAAHPRRVATDDSLSRRIIAFLVYVKENTDPVMFYLRCLFYIIMVAWGWYFISLDYYYTIDGHRIDAATPEIYESLLHNVNLVFHEAGHVIFRPLGHRMTVLGGSLLQILIPLTVMITFLFKERNTFGAAFGLWWTGQNFLDVAPYINDARAGQIPLLGGGTGMDRPEMHDWRNFLSEVGWLQHDHAIAAVVDNFGVVLIGLSLVWAATVLKYQYFAMPERRQRGSGL